MTLYLSQPPTPTTPRPVSGLNFFTRIKSAKDTRPDQRTPVRPSTARTSSYAVNDKLEVRGSLFSVPAREGVGLKARRLSLGLQEEIVVDTCELDDEFTSASKFGFRQQCGKGASATVKIMVRKGNKKSETCQFAVKEFRKRSSRESEEEYVRKVKSEYTIAKSLHHPNIVETVRLCTHAGRWNQVMEYCSQGELFGLVDRKYMKNEDKACIFKQVLRGVSYLHDHGIAHRDIKLENLLMTENGYIKITDFGVSEKFSGEHPGLPSSHGLCGNNMGHIRLSAPGICGSKPYIAPEVLQEISYDPRKLDVWSCGVLYMTLLLNGNPWQLASKKEANYAQFMEGWTDYRQRFGDTPISENSYPQCGPLFTTIPTQGQRRCILKMLNPDPDTRCTIQDALADRWIKSVNCCSPDAPNERSKNGIDVSKMGCHELAAKMNVQAKHDHLPPPVKRLPQHKFDMGDGTSRYD